MKAVLMSIKPKWCEKIFSGKKTVEVRKIAPKLETPYKVYVYCTKKAFDITDIYDLSTDVVRKVADGRGKVIGEWVCDTVEENIPDYNPAYERFFYNSFECGADCLTSDEIAAYGKGDPLCGLHITAPKLYDEPKALSEFRKPDVWYKTETGNTSTLVHETGTTITRPPQSFCYVEEIEE